MNGKKVLNRLILLFVVLNLILATFNVIASSRRYVVDGERLQNLYAVLEQQNVDIESNLSIDFEPRPTINIIYEINTNNIRDGIVRSIFEDNISEVLRSTEKSQNYKGFERYQFEYGGEKLSFEKYDVEYTNQNVDKTLEGVNKDIAKRHIEIFVKKIGIEDLYKNMYIEYEEANNYIKAKCYPVIESTVMDDIYISVEVYKDGISQAHFPVVRVETVENSYRDITPIDRVLFGIDAYINNMLGIQLDNIVIKDVKLVYKKQNPESYNLWGEKNIPMYKMNIGDLEKPIFVNAYTNEYVK